MKKEMKKEMKILVKKHTGNRGFMPRFWEEKTTVMGRQSCHDSGKEIGMIWNEDLSRNFAIEFDKNIEGNYNNEGYDNNDESDDKKPRMWEGDVGERCNKRLTHISSPKLSQIYTLTNKIEIKSELVRFNFV